MSAENIDPAAVALQKRMSAYRRLQDDIENLEQYCAGLLEDNENLSGLVISLQSENKTLKKHSDGLEMRCSEAELRPPLNGGILRRLRYLVQGR